MAFVTPSFKVGNVDNVTIAELNQHSDNITALAGLLVFLSRCGYADLGDARQTEGINRSDSIVFQNTFRYLWYVTKHTEETQINYGAVIVDGEEVEPAYSVTVPASDRPAKIQLWNTDEDEETEFVQALSGTRGKTHGYVDLWQSVPWITTGVIYHVYGAEQAFEVSNVREPEDV